MLDWACCRYGCGLGLALGLVVRRKCKLAESQLHATFSSPCLVGKIQETLAVIVDDRTCFVNYKERVVELGFCLIVTVLNLGIAYADFAMQVLGCVARPASAGACTGRL